jgi:type IV secretory pathway VirB3-like protein
MLGKILSVIALRPLLTLSILGLPIILLVAVGLLTILALKFLIFVVAPIVIIIWVVRKIFGNNEPTPPSTI